MIYINMKKGFIAGNFDVLHPGYIKMFQECKSQCDHLTVLLHIDPSFERPHKLKPILTVDERREMLLSLKAVDAIQTYLTEKDLLDLMLLSDFNIRFLGDDYEGRIDYTGYGMSFEIYFLNREHGWSTTKFKEMIAASLNKTK